MFFVKVGSVIAWLATIGGFAKMVLSYWLAYSVQTHEEMVAVSKRYLATETTGEAINESTLLFVFGILVGLLVHIAKNIKTPDNHADA